MKVRIDEEWKEKLYNEFDKPYFQQLAAFIREEYATRRVFPPAKQIFSAFDHCPFSKVKVVILGQDPYHGPGQANGLCFSVNPQVAQPPSLLNNFKELKDDLERPIPPHGNLESWALQGVLLLNAILTVRAHQAGSHRGKGWEQFTDAAISALSKHRRHLVFMLWGSYAQKKGQMIDSSHHLILSSPHPSPLAAHRGFFGNRHFSKANHYLQKMGHEPINW